MTMEDTPLPELYYVMTDGSFYWLVYYYYNYAMAIV